MENLSVRSVIQVCKASILKPKQPTTETMGLFRALFNREASCFGDICLRTVNIQEGSDIEFIERIDRILADKGRPKQSMHGASDSVAKVISDQLDTLEKGYLSNGFLLETSNYLSKRFGYGGDWKFNESMVQLSHKMRDMMVR